MQTQTITTELGEISVSLTLSLDPQAKGQPLVFMHGIFLDKTLWFDCSRAFSDRQHIYIDMPAHGQSSDVGRPWRLEECVAMLIRVLDTLKVETCIAVGHSWGGMTALRAAAQHPERFKALCLFNTPFQAATGMRRVGFHLQKFVARFQRFYAQQAAKSMYSQTCREAHPELSQQMQGRLAVRSGQEIAQVIDAVILGAGDSTPLLQHLQIPILFVIGQSDFVGIPPRETLIVPGRHISPHEAPEEIRLAMQYFLSSLETSF